MSLMQKILDKTNKVENAITREARLEGQIENQMEILKTQHQCSSIKAAKTMSLRLKKKAKDKEEEIEEGLEKLEEDYNWE